MKERLRLPGIAVVVVVLATVAVLAVFSGCTRREPPAHENHEGHDHAAMARPQAQEAVAVEQTTCPVMGGAINKDIFVEYKGKKVYFCCKGCDQTFQQNPEKYMAKLPQFQN